MNDKRYLKDSDYKKSIFLSQLDQLTQGDEETLLDAELDAKACVTSMLTDEYEIEKEFDLGETILDFHAQKEYFKGDYVFVEGRLSKAKTYVSGSKAPKSESYWRLMDLTEIDEDTLFETYDQSSAYYNEDIVLYGESYFECLIANGISVEYGEEDIVQPSTTVYWEASTYEIWDLSVDYSSYSANTSLVEESGSEYALIDPNGVTVGKTPSQSILDGESNWMVVDTQPYDRTERYIRGNGFDGYVTYNDEYFFVSEENEENVNGYLSDDEKFVFAPSPDPRNRNIVSTMVHLVIYQLCSVAVPDNIPSVRISNRDAAMKKLQDFSSMKTSPSIDRKVFTITTCNSITGEETSVEKKASKWAVNESASTRDNWRY